MAVKNEIPMKERNKSVCLFTFQEVAPHGYSAFLSCGNTEWCWKMLHSSLVLDMLRGSREEVKRVLFLHFLAKWEAVVGFCSGAEDWESWRRIVEQRKGNVGVGFVSMASRQRLTVLKRFERVGGVKSLRWMTI